MPRILVSSCLPGQSVRYNGGDKPTGADEIHQSWKNAGLLVPICPEIAELDANFGPDVTYGKSSPAARDPRPKPVSAHI